MKSSKLFHGFFITTLILSLLEGSWSHKAQRVTLQTVPVSGFVNQSRIIPLPFKKCFEIQAEVPTNNKYFEFKPSTISLQKTKESLLKKSDQISLLQDLRTPNTFRYKNIIIFQDYILLFLAPKKVIIVREKKHQFIIERQYEVKEADYSSQLKMFKFGKEVYVQIYESKQALLLNQIGYTNLQLPQPMHLSHFQALQSKDQFIAAEYTKGFGHYKIDRQNKRVEVLGQYKNDFFKRDQIYLVDFSMDSFKENRIYFLDGKSGVFQVDFQTNDDTKSIDFSRGFTSLIIQQSDCQALDAIKDKHFILVCGMGSSSYIIEAFEETQKNGDKKFKKVQPSFHQTFLNDIKISGDYYLVFSRKAINVFWNSAQSTFSQLIKTQTQLNLPGLQTFSMNDENSIYTIQSGMLIKYQISEAQPTLTFRSSKPLSKAMNVFMYGMCSQLSQLQSSKKNNICQVSQKIQVRIAEEVSPEPIDFSISASIIVILIVVLLVIIWICLKKYQSLEREARKVLDAYKKKKPTQKFVF